MLPDWKIRLLAGAVVVPVVFGTAVSASPLATAETQDTRTAPIAASNQGTADQADTTNNGEDLTRPLNSFETRLRRDLREPNQPDQPRHPDLAAQQQGDLR